MLMLTGRLPLHEGMQVLAGCFVLLDAPVIPAGFSMLGRIASSRAASFSGN
jgi:hypothetical protein